MIEKITFIRNDNDATADEVLQISYLQDIDRTPDKFAAPKVRTNSSLSKIPSGIQWLFHLADGTLVK